MLDKLIPVSGASAADLLDALVRSGLAWGESSVDPPAFSAHSGPAWGESSVGLPVSSVHSDRAEDEFWDAHVFSLEARPVLLRCQCLWQLQMRFRLTFPESLNPSSERRD